MIRRRYLKLAGAATAPGLAAGCLGGNSGNRIQFLNDRAARQVWESAASEFNSQSDYNLDITWLPKGNSVDEQISKMKAAGNMPALVFKNTADCYRETNDGLTAPLTDVVEETGVKDTISIDGESYHVPIVALPLHMTYNSDIINGDPRTREEWLSEARRVKNEEGTSGYVVASGRTNAAETHAVQSLWNSGTDIYSGTTDNIEITIDNGENRDRAIETYSWLQEMNELGPQASGWAWGDCIGALTQENLAAWAGIGGLAIQQMLANRPEIAKKFKPAPYPQASGQDHEPWWSFFEGFLAYKEADNLEGAREFIKFFMKSDYYYEYLRKTAPFSYPTSKDALSEDGFTSAEVFNTYSEYLDLIVENWDKMKPVTNTGDNGSPNIVATRAYDTQLTGQSVDQLLYNDKSPEETVDWFASQLREANAN